MGNGKEFDDNKLDTETRQAITRLSVGGLVMGLLLAWIFNSQVPAIDYIKPLTIWLGYALFASLWLIIVLVSPGDYPSRRFLGLGVDVIAVSLLLHLTPTMLGALYVVYLWVILDYGFRYGTSYFMVALAGATLAFATVIAATPFWGHQPWVVTLGGLTGLVALPLYVSAKVRRLRATQRTVVSVMGPKKRIHRPFEPRVAYSLAHDSQSLPPAAGSWTGPCATTSPAPASQDQPRTRKRSHPSSAMVPPGSGRRDADGRTFRPVPCADR